MSPFHPDYGLPDEFRIRVVAYSRLTTVTAAARFFRVARCSVVRWRKAYK